MLMMMTMMMMILITIINLEPNVQNMDMYRPTIDKRNKYESSLYVVRVIFICTELL